MFTYLSQSTDPHFNLALEEFLFRQKEDFILLYINSDAVICGKHQNAVAESNSQFLFENKVPLIRRFSGGGTVYHDKGNINLSFIHTGKDNKVIDFKKYALKIIDFLKDLGVEAVLSERHDIFVDGKKITGNAAHAKNKRALHHGTLLFNSDLDRLSLGLKSNKDKFKSRAVKSNRSPVTNLKDHLSSDIELDNFIQRLMKYLKKEFSSISKHTLQDIDIQEINNLSEEKYQTFKWNYGYGPKYSFEASFIIDKDDVLIKAEVEEGIIIAIESDSVVDWSTFIGLNHEWSVISNKLVELFGEAKAKNLIHHFF